VFAPEGLLTPRMPPHVYKKMKQHILSLLRQHFRYVETAIEAPAKKDYGDIDILVAEPIERPSSAFTPEDLAAFLASTTSKKTRGSSTTHVAVPWPEEEGTNTPPQVTIKFVQVDIHVCPSSEALTWDLFHHAHGDLWNILRAIIRPLGLTCTSRGLFLRIEEIQPHNKDLSRVFMTDNSSEVLKYLGLEEQRFWRSFSSWDDMMDYAATCRFHDPKRGKDRDAEKIKETLRHNDRQRTIKRPIFGYWVETYLPAHRDNPPGSSASMTREEVVGEARRWFGNDFAANYEHRKSQGMRAMGVEKLWSDIRKSLPVEGVEIGYVIKGMKREIVGDAEGKSVEEMARQQRDYAGGRFDAVAEWGRDNWKEVGERQKALDREKSAQHLFAKGERERQEGEKAVGGEK